MALNQLMHPRNPYKEKPPDFAEFAKKYPEFRKFCKIELSGKVKTLNINIKFIAEIFLICYL